MKRKMHSRHNILAHSYKNFIYKLIIFKKNLKITLLEEKNITLISSDIISEFIDSITT